MKKKPNFYGICKGILSEGMTLNNWWADKDLSEDGFFVLVADLEKYFGRDALLRGVKNAQEENKEIPQIVLDYGKA